MLHLYFEDLFEETLNYAKNMPPYAHIYISTQTTKKKKIIEKLVKDFPHKITVIVVNNRGRDVSTLTVAFRKYILNYDIICFAHDKKVSQSAYTITGKEYAYLCYENILASTEFVENIITKFALDKHLGLLVPPIPQFEAYYGVLVDRQGWSTNYEICLNFAKRLGINVNMDCTKSPIAPYGSIFWFRVDALKPLFDLKLDYNDFPDEPLPIDGTISHAIERMHPFIAQSRGYYSATIFSEKFARIRLTTLQFMLSELNKRILSIFPYAYFEEELRKLDYLQQRLSLVLNSKLFKFTKPLIKWVMNKLIQKQNK